MRRCQSIGWQRKCRGRNLQWTTPSNCTGCIRAILDMDPRYLPASPCWRRPGLWRLLLLYTFYDASVTIYNSFLLCLIPNHLWLPLFRPLRFSSAIRSFKPLRKVYAPTARHVSTTKRIHEMPFHKNIYVSLLLFLSFLCTISFNPLSTFLLPGKYSQGGTQPFDRARTRYIIPTARGDLRKVPSGPNS